MNNTNLYKVVYLTFSGEECIRHIMIVSADSPAMARENVEYFCKRDGLQFDNFESTNLAGSYFAIHTGVA